MEGGRSEAVSWGAVGAFAVLTVALIGRMLWYLRWSVTDALRIDQWVMLEELWRWRDGHTGLGYLWTPYWGHRAVLPRLLMLADERWFGYANAPLVVVNLLAASASAGLLAWVAWRALRERSPVLRVLAGCVAAHLLLSSLQMENFAYGMGVQYTLFVLLSVAALVLGARAFGEARVRGGLVAAGLGCAWCACLCLGSGVLLFPVMAWEAWVLRRSWRWVVWLVSAGVVWAVVYAIGYSNPGEGMGVAGLLRRPWSAVLVAAMFLGGQLSNWWLPVGEAAGLCGMAAVVVLVWRWMRHHERGEFAGVALGAVALFLAGVALTIALGRISPEWLQAHSTEPLPSRYMTLPFVFWTALFASVLGWRGRGWNWAALGAVSVVVAALTLGTVRWQTVFSTEWFHYYRRMDAAAAGLLVGVDDAEWMGTMYPDGKLLARWSGYLREKHLSVFREERARWMGARLAASQWDACRVEVRATKFLANSTERVEGRVEARGVTNWRKSDLVFLDGAGRVEGLGRTLGENDGAAGGDRFMGYTRVGYARVVCVRP